MFSAPVTTAVKAKIAHARRSGFDEYSADIVYLQRIAKRSRYSRGPIIASSPTFVVQNPVFSHTLVREILPETTIRVGFMVLLPS
jgi:hypothetical protein